MWCAHAKREIRKDGKNLSRDGGSVLFLPIPIQVSLVIPIPIPCSKDKVNSTVKVMRFISYNITFNL